MLYSEFHAISRTPSSNFTQFSRNFGYFCHFWANFNMLGIKLHVLKLRNSMVILSCTFRQSFTQLHAIFTQFHPFLAISGFFVIFNMVGIKKHVLELRNSLVVLADAVGLQKGPEAPQKGQRPPKGAESPSAALCKSWTFWCNAPKYSSVKHIMIVKFIS